MGSRFDLMAPSSIETMKKVYETLHATESHLLLYGEPWAVELPACPPISSSPRASRKDWAWPSSTTISAIAFVEAFLTVQRRGFATQGQGLV